MEKQQKEIDQTLLQLQQDIKKMYADKENISKEQKKREQQLTQKRSRFSVLSEMEKEHEGYYRSVKSILHLKSSGNEKWQGICGVVGELLHVAEKYEAAIEIALGGNLQNIITKTEYDAKEAIQYLKQYHLGRATFLPITSIKGRKLIKEEILSENGVLGVASDLVEYDAVYDTVIQSLLGRTIIVENIDMAVLLSKKYHNQYRMVTLGGDLFNIGGAMTGGSVAKKTTSVFSRSREINDLSKDIEQEQILLQNCQKQLEMLEQQLEQNHQLSMQKQMKKQEIQLSLQKNEEDKQNTENLLLERQQKQKLYDLEQKQIAEQCEFAEKEMTEFKQIVEQAEQKMNDINERLSAFQYSMTEEKQHRENILSAITELKVNISAEEQNKKAVKDNIQRLKQQNVTLEKQQEQIQQEITSLQELSKQKELEQKELEQKNVYYKQQEQSQQSIFTTLTENREQKKQEIVILEQQQKEMTETISLLNNEIFRIETKQQKIEEEKQRLFDEIWEEYEMTYQMVKQQYDTKVQITSYQKLKSDVKQWKSQIKELGAVNVEAIENYKEVKQRYSFLTTQRTDILEAEQKLHLLISDLSQMMENRFREQFDVISKNFGEVFREMFGGGKAYLKLSDETKVLESSIEIIAQPPGKSLQNMLLLSGGERALTAIAILFSILKMKPSPFCILDEIEAALDDANVKRYADYLKKFSKDTQFIVITHRKGTMEAADVMYGVTMQEKGVSKMISVNFEDKAYV